MDEWAKTVEDGSVQQLSVSIERVIYANEENGYAVSGNNCPRGEEYGKNEVIAPKRTITSTVKVSGGLYPRLPVKTDKPVPKELLFECMTVVNAARVSPDAKLGDVVVEIK